MEKKIFMIAVTDDDGSLNREYTNAIYELLTTQTRFVDEYNIEPHYMKPVHDLHQSLNDALRGEQYEGYIVLLDCLEGEVYNPNVMFELGAIFYSRKPYVVISSHPKETIPFDINIINVLSIPQVIINYIKEYYSNQKKVDAYSHFCVEEQSAKAKDKSAVHDFIIRAFNQYKSCLAKIDSKNEEYIDLKNISESINEVKRLVSNTAEYIDGEAAAFSALKEAVSHTEISLRTTRFANESIVKDTSISEQREFMKSLYAVSEKISDRFNRIICNNHPAKWQDIYDILLYGENGAKVYVRKHDFSIHFELVVIDEKVGFIHFYQEDTEMEGSKTRGEVEKIKSTLKIQGSSICKRLASIFDRLHHRDFQNESPSNPSRTLLGIPTKESDNIEAYANYGCFTVDKSILKFSSQRGKYIIDMFKEAFQKWQITDFNDRIIMASGIALVEGSDSFIEEMNKQNRINQDEYNAAKELYNKETQKK